ncbi:unnamed protein product [Angiostrongylus costaricensis]|uniref:FAD/NAD(P)-binding domain-containing protein n=1 Tax=Angiostrongylus costaricensis TaxID=334426 RepID=A0A158PGT4_ANGCS|nr:unnamed protein product [Angiostrongylus costaricensis]
MESQPSNSQRCNFNGMMAQGGSKRFIIIGSGPTAIGAAYRLHELIEEAHLPKSTEAYMRHVINDDENIEANYVPYPVQDSIPYFPAEIKRRCLEEICSASKCTKIASNFDEFTLNTFGPTLQAIFIRPYNEKVWTVPLSEMNTVWVENRIPRTSIEDLKRRCGLSREELIDEENRKAVSMFRPRRSVGLQFHVSVVTRWQVFKTFSDMKTGFFDAFMFTISVITGKITGIFKAANIAIIAQVVLVGIGMRRPQPKFTEKLSWLYFPQPHVIFYRCTFMSNFNEHLTPNAALFWSVLVEIGMKVDEPVNEPAILESAINDLIEHGIIYTTCIIESKWIYVLPYGYPIPTLDRDIELKKAHRKLEKENIYSRGSFDQNSAAQQIHQRENRFGSWRYEAANQDHSFTMGAQVVDKIVFGSKENV